MSNLNQIRRSFTDGFTAYNFLNVLGEETFGTVYECRDTTNGGNIAIKAIDNTVKASHYISAQHELDVLDGLRNKSTRHHNLIEVQDNFTQGDLTCTVFSFTAPQLPKPWLNTFQGSV